MKKPTSRVHPSSSFNPLAAILPTALLALATTLNPEEQEVLAYLLSSQQKHQQQLTREKNKTFKGKKQQHLKNQNQNHPPDLGCCCFTCYKSFWARWDASPNRHIIHRIIDDFEETLECKTKEKKAKKKRGSPSKSTAVEASFVDDGGAMGVEEEEEDKGAHTDAHGHDDEHHGDGYAHEYGYAEDDGEEDDEEEEEVEIEEGKSSVRRFVSWVFRMGGN